MRVTEVRTLAVDANWRNLVFVQVHTDAGIVGVGEATLETRDRSVVAAIQDLSRYVLGQDPGEIERIWNTMYRDGYWGAGPVDSTAMGGIEQALWDIAGKRLGVPVHSLLGGRMRRRLRAYANGWYFGLTTPEQHADKAAELMERGFSAFKWDPFRISGREISSEDLDYAVECVARVRERVGPGALLLIEGHGRFSVASAVRIADALERFHLYAFEEPIPHENFAALRKVSERIRIPLAAGERCYSAAACRALLQEQAVDLLQPDLSHCGGILAVKKIAAMAETWYVGVAPHNASGPVHTAAVVHVDATLPNFALQETFPFDVERAPWLAGIVDRPVAIRDGFLEVPDAPGLGLELAVAEVRAHPPRERPVYSLYSTDSFLLTGTGESSDRSEF